MSQTLKTGAIIIRCCTLLRMPSKGRVGFPRNKVGLAIAGLVAPGLFFVSWQKLAAQTTGSNANEPVPAFSVVSVKPSNPNSSAVLEITPDEFVERKNTVMWLIESAYGIHEERLVLGAPSWIKEERYDVLAKVDESDIKALSDLKPQQRFFMLRPVLEERFHLRYHLETRVLPEYVLTIAKNGSKLKPSKPAGAVPPEHVWKISGRYELDAKDIPISQLCSYVLSTEAQQLVVDQTGLTGTYDFTLRWSREDAAAGLDTSAKGGNDAPDIFTAVRDQLGLTLSPLRVPMPVLVVDHIERPSEN